MKNRLHRVGIFLFPALVCFSLVSSADARERGEGSGRGVAVAGLTLSEDEERTNDSVDLYDFEESPAGFWFAYASSPPDPAANVSSPHFDPIGLASRENFLNRYASDGSVMIPGLLPSSVPLLSSLLPSDESDTAGGTPFELENVFPAGFLQPEKDPSGAGRSNANWYKPDVDPYLLRIATPTDTTYEETFHWKPALSQSLRFLIVEHAFRMADDPYARHLVWHKRFWDDYLQSANHFHMSRWGDGDDFLTNYIGHPMEGAVSGLIQIQNDPHGRSAKFGKSSLYWQSRLKGMAWAAVYSAYFEIGPVLSETALGNEGGYTYVEHCGWAPCSKPGRKLKPPTNNTGWVDFTVTPLVGMGWVVLEDSIEREIVDRLAKDDPRFRWKVLRGALSPSHAMANMLAGQAPWYRVTPQGEVALNSGMKFVRQPANSGNGESNDHFDEALNQWEFGIGYTSLNLPEDWEGCTACRIAIPGMALNVDRQLSRWFAADGEVDLLPGNGGGPGQTGGATEGLFGLKIGHPNHSWGIFTTVRAGFIYYDKVLATGSQDHYEHMTRFASDIGEFFEYYPSRHSTIRFGVSDTMVRYLNPQPDSYQPPISVLSDALIDTHSNLQLRSEYVFRF